jgi:hypothetical protein
LLTVYLVITSLTTVRPVERGSKVFDVSALLLALAVGALSMKFGFDAVANGGTRNGMPAFPFFMFGTVGLLATAGDARMLRSGALTGGKRLARHLWRMCFALFIASMSFFIGQADVIPKPIRVRPLLALPVLAVLVTMLWWLWRVRIRRTFQGMVRVRAAAAPG